MCTADHHQPLFWKVFWLTALFKAVMAYRFPLTGDEAYFILWGQHPAFGYYDHGPMTGWWLSVVFLFGRSTWLVRLPALLTSHLVAWIIFSSVRKTDPRKAALAAILFLISPAGLLMFLYTTDTPLLLFSVLAGVQAKRAWNRQRSADWFLTGLLLGGAFLSKYFAVLLGIAFAVAIVLMPSQNRRLRAFIALATGVLPAVLINLSWNMNHSWANILFNVVNRNPSAGLSWASLLTLIATMAFLAGPGILWYGLKPHNKDRIPCSQAWRTMRSDGVYWYALSFAVPVLLLSIVSLSRTIGMHWLISFFAFLYLALPVVFQPRGLVRILKPSAVFAGILVFACISITFLPVHWAQSSRSYASIVLGRYPHEVLKAAGYNPEVQLLAGTSYTQAAILSFHSDQYAPVLGRGNYHGRQDDLVTDFRKFHGQNKLLVTTRNWHAQVATKWFETADLRTIKIRGAKFTVLDGQNFDFDLFREQVLSEIARRYYSPPPFLRALTRRCYFRERYGLPYEEETDETDEQPPECCDDDLC